MSDYLDRIKFKIEALSSFDYLTSLSPGDFVRLYILKKNKDDIRDWYDLKFCHNISGVYSFCDVKSNYMELHCSDYGETWVIDKNPIVSLSPKHSKYINLSEFIKLPNDGIKDRKHHH